MKSDRLVFLDTETTSLRPDRRVWEIGLFWREDGSDSQPHHWFIRREDLDLANADLKSLEIGRFYERHPHATLQPLPLHSEREVLREVERITRGATIVGAVPNFDTEVLGARMRANGLCPSWHYHLVDVETLAAGALGIAPPWDFDKILEAFRLVYDEADRHTAVGDARMVRDLYDAVMKFQDGERERMWSAAAFKVLGVPREEVEARLAAATTWASDHPEARCGRCRGPNVRRWSAPSPLWNAVMRGGDINGDELYGGIVCPVCFAALAEEAGIAELWRLDAERVHVELATVTPSGRVWNPQTWLWEDRSADHPDQVQAQLVRNLTAAGIVRRDAFTWPQTCPNVSFYGRRCELPPHGWDQACMFTPDREGEYNLTDGSTMRDLLEALTAGGRVAVSAAMRWHEYHLHSQATEAERDVGPNHWITQGKWGAVAAAQDQREIVIGYLDRRAAEGVPADAGASAQREQLTQDEEAVAEREGES